MKKKRIPQAYLPKGWLHPEAWDDGALDGPYQDAHGRWFVRLITVRPVEATPPPDFHFAHFTRDGQKKVYIKFVEVDSPPEGK